MKTIFLVAMSFLMFAGCKADDSLSGGSEAPFVCSDPPQGLWVLEIGTTIHDSMYEGVFDTVEPSRFQNEFGCSEQYDFNQFNPDTGEFCYYLSIGTTCDTGYIVDIYDGGE
jgi:hypothetical protein